MKTARECAFLIAFVVALGLAMLAAERLMPW